MTDEEEAASRHRAFEVETIPHRKVLCQAAYSLLRSPAEAEDAVQDTYLQAWKSFDSFVVGTNCRAWLLCILFNKVRHHRRKWALPFVSTDDPTNFERAVDPADTYISDDLTDTEILDVLQKLPLAYSEVILLAEVHEYTYKQISEMIGRPIGTVMSRISRGRELLRQALSQAAEARGILRKPRVPAAEAATQKTRCAGAV